jgi:hypothetical protein
MKNCDRKSTTPSRVRSTERTSTGQPRNLTACMTLKSNSELNRTARHTSAPPAPTPSRRDNFYKRYMTQTRHLESKVNVVTRKLCSEIHPKTIFSEQLTNNPEKTLTWIPTRSRPLSPAPISVVSVKQKRPAHHARKHSSSEVPNSAPRG